MKSRPLVLITPCAERKGAEFLDPSLSLSDRYPRAIVAAGGMPWVLPCWPAENIVAEAVRRCDGVMLTGGDDVQPKLYANALPPRLERTVSPADATRDLWELLLIREVFRQHKPLLAICRGQQILNVALGGTLIVDIPTQMPRALNHGRLDRKDKIVHKVALTPGSILNKITGKQTLGVNSSHHQAVGRLGGSLCVTAVSPDGVVEGLELAEAARQRLPWLVAVQFHPERLFEKHEVFLALFRSFIRACEPKRKSPV
jgi:putative glutamine amidotransferase